MTSEIKKTHSKINPEAAESVSWVELSSPIKGFSCLTSGREWGTVRKARTRAQGDGWSSTMAGFFMTLEEAQREHVAAIVKRRAELAEPQPERTVAYLPTISTEEWCRQQGKVFVDHKMRNLDRLEQEQPARFHR